MKTKQKIFLAKILYYFINFFLPKQAEIKRNGINWNLDFSEAIDLHILIFGSFEKEIINCAKKLNLKKFGNIIDIGANFGAQSLQFAKEFDNSLIYSIEPTNYAYDKFMKNLKLNSDLSKNIKSFNLFIGSQDQKKPEFIYSSWNLSSKEIKHPKHLGEKKDTKNVKIKTFKEFLIENSISNVDFVKLDVDGYEYYVLESGFEFLKEKKPPIFMELAPYLYEEYGYSKELFLKLIKSLDYEFYDLKNLNKIIDIDYKVSKIKDGSSENILLM